jgi:hypothetical protein
MLERMTNAEPTARVPDQPDDNENESESADSDKRGSRRRQLSR